MNAPLRRIGVVVMILFGLLFANLNWVQAYKGDEYRTHELNCRTRITEYERPRGLIAVGQDTQAAAVSTQTEEPVVAYACDRYLTIPYVREYPLEQPYAHVIGFQSLDVQSTGLERAENELLSGTSDKLFVERLRDLFTGSQSPGGNVLTTLAPSAQETAYEQLRNNATGTNKGAVVALDPRTGAVQAMVSVPSFDPEPLAVPDPEAVGEIYEELDTDPDRPLVNRAVRTDTLDERDDRGAAFFPGSVFKIIDAAAALENGYEPDSTLDGGSEYTAPTAGSAIGNAPGVVCPDEISLRQALVVSCNTAFSRLAAEELGGDVLQQTAQAFGIGDDDLRLGRLDGDGIPVAASTLGDLTGGREDGQDDPPTVALTAIGQASVQFTPLQGAMIAATVANDGVQMHPYLVEELQDSELRPVYSASPEELRRSVSPEVAAQLQDMMVGVVQSGTGGNAQFGDYVVGGKTGTAESSGGDQIDHGWFVGFVIDDGEPVSAAAVMLENAGQGGSAEAARIAGEVMAAAIGEQGGG